ncbi:MAG: hypothetical protein ACR2RF_16935 [Geminicoccaceae bacterium]
MKRTKIFFAIAWLVWPGTSALADDPSSIEAFLGKWKGDQVSSETESLPSDALDLQVQSDRNGFRISWRDLSTGSSGGPGAQKVNAHFQRTGRPGVYEYVEESGSFLTRMFASPSTGNPLEGETLLWARVGDLTLTVYSMSVEPNGGFNLDRYSWVQTESGLLLRYSERTEDLADETKIEGELVALGK